MKEFMLKHPFITMLLASKGIDCVYKLVDKHLDSKLPESYWENKKLETTVKHTETLQKMMEALESKEDEEEDDDSESQTIEADFLN